RDGLGHGPGALGRRRDVELAHQAEDRGAAVRGDEPGEAGLHVSALQKCDISPLIIIAQCNESMPYPRIATYMRQVPRFSPLRVNGVTLRYWSVRLETCHCQPRRLRAHWVGESGQPSRVR